MTIPNSSGTRCPKCENSRFELVEDFPTKSAYKMYYIRCIGCRTFLHAIPYFDTNNKIDLLQADIDKIKSKIGIF